MRRGNRLLDADHAIATLNLRPARHAFSLLVMAVKFKVPIRDKRRAAWVSLIAVFGLLLLKAAAGWYTHSLGIWAEAGQSGVDLFTTAFTLISIVIASRPADADHPFGHEKFENFAAFVQAAILLGTGFWIAAHAIHRLIEGKTLQFVPWPAFAVMVISIVVAGWRSHELKIAAHIHGSDALEADALNFTTDIWTSSGVLLGLILTVLSRMPGLAWLNRADAFAALGVSLVMAGLAIRLGRKTAGVLLDEAPRQLMTELRRQVGEVPGMLGYERLRLRRAGNRYFVDLRLAVPRTLTLERARQVRDEAAARVERMLPGADVVVDTVPRQPGRADLFEQIRAVAQSRNLGVHEISVYRLDQGLHAEFHLEVPEAMPLRRAHDLVSEIETEIRHQAPQLRRILTHIEPQEALVTSAAAVNRDAMRRHIEELAHTVPEVMDCHDIQLKTLSGHLELSCHCSFPDSTPVGRVHELTTRLESELKRAYPELMKVTIHTEPVSDNQR